MAERLVLLVLCRAGWTMLTNTVTPDGYELDDTGAYYDSALSE